MERSYRSRKSRTTYTASGDKDRAYLVATGEAATSPKVVKQVADVRKCGYDFATVDWIARQLSNSY